MKSPHFLEIFENMLVQKILAEAIEYVPLNFILAWSTHDILSHQQWEHILKTWQLNALSTRWLQTGIAIPDCGGVWLCRRGHAWRARALSDEERTACAINGLQS